MIYTGSFWNELRDNTLNTCDDTSVVGYGIFGKESPLSTLDQCKVACEADVQCAFIFYQPQRPMCHLHTQCSVTRMAGGNPGIVMELVKGGMFGFINFKVALTTFSATLLFLIINNDNFTYNIYKYCP